MPLYHLMPMLRICCEDWTKKMRKYIKKSSHGDRKPSDEYPWQERNWIYRLIPFCIVEDR
jgi:hypothetical protein